MKASPNDKINEMLVYIAKLNNQLLNPSRKHNTDVRLKSYKSWIYREIQKAQKTIDSLRG